MNGNDAKEQAANTAHVHAVEQAAAQALVEEKESESRFRHYGKGPWAAAISALAVVFSLFQMYASTFSAFDAMTLRSWHIIFLLVLSFLMYPAWKGERRSRTRPTLFDALCIAAGLFSFGYLILNYTEITLRGGYFLPETRRLRDGFGGPLVSAACFFSLSGVACAISCMESALSHFSM